ncbi:hypothetical protein Tco_1116257 [Tanacetum coccineum]
MDSIRKTLENNSSSNNGLHLLKQKTLMQTQEDHSHQTQAVNTDSLKVDLVVKQNSCSEKEDSNSETASSKSAKECSLNSETQDVHAIKYKMSKAKERCMAYFRSLHSHLQVLSKDDLKGTRIEHGFKRALGDSCQSLVKMLILSQETMLLNVDQLQKQLDKDEFQEDGSMAAFWVVNNQFQKFINSKFTLDYDSQMTDTYFVEYTGLEVQHFRDTLLQHLVQEQESKIDMGKALDANLVDTKSIRTDSTMQDDSRGSGNDTDADDADIRPIYDEEPMAEIKRVISKPGRQIFTGHRFSTIRLRLLEGLLLYFLTCIHKLKTQGSIDLTVFITKHGEDILLVQIYVDDIIFGSTNPELTYLDHAGCLDSHKSTSGGIQFLDGDKLVSWSSKKQDCTSMYSAEAEYVSLSACCAQVLWLRTQLTDYGFHFDKIPMYYDSKAAIAISCNPVHHSRTKHIDVRYHFIKEQAKKGIVELFFVGTEYQLADLFTKALSEDRFKYLVRRLGMRCLTSDELEVLANESA